MGIHSSLNHNGPVNALFYKRTEHPHLTVNATHDRQKAHIGNALRGKIVFHLRGYRTLAVLQKRQPGAF